MNPGGNKRYFETWRKLAEDPTLAPVQRHIIAKYDSQAGKFGYTLQPETLKQAEAAR
jgi:hypothetical protein